MVALGAEEVRRLRRTEHVVRQRAYRAHARGRQTVSEDAHVLAGLMFLISGDQRMVEVYLLTQLRADTETETCGRVEGIRGATAELLASPKRGRWPRKHGAVPIRQQSSVRRTWWPR